ncbi:MAG: polyphosphate kinase 1 [Planctomycetota bacterium]
MEDLRTDGTESTEPAPPSEAGGVDLKDPALYLNRELSQLAFIRRVLAMAQDDRTPLLERLRFLCITGSVLDEFFEIRVAGLLQQIDHGSQVRGPEGLELVEVHRRIAEQAKELVRGQYALLNGELIPLLAAEGICILRREDWTQAQRAWLHDYFERELLPILTPQGLDPAHPFPKVVNKNLNFMIQLEGSDGFGREATHAVLHAPRSLPRVVQLPAEVSDHPYDFVFLSSILHEFADELFPGLRIGGCYQYRVTRNSDLLFDEEESEDLRHALEGELQTRNWGAAVRLEASETMPRELADFLLSKFDLDDLDFYLVDGPVNLSRLATIPDLVHRPDLKFAPFLPGLPKVLRQGRDLFEVLGQQDVLLHHPYQSFRPVVEWIQLAARDPKVLMIKQTLYRTERGSPLVEALIQAARNGKEVTAIIELRARFDEQANIEMAQRLQDAGAYVSYGVVGYKSHAKMTLVVRKEGDRLRRYVHLGTGNYHSGNARQYTDFGLLTCDPKLAGDVHKIFQELTSLGKPRKLKRLLQSPFTLHESLLKMVKGEVDNARAGRRARILAKCNAVTEPQVIRALYEASQAGVEVHLIVRGICCLRPGVPGVSDRIQVRSIVGRFLEHHRVYYFENGGEPKIWLSSADLMDRNLIRRVETCFPVEDPKLFRRVLREGLEVFLEDEEMAWEMRPDGTYDPLRSGPGTSAQQRLLDRLAE